MLPPLPATCCLLPSPHPLFQRRPLRWFLSGPGFFLSCLGTLHILQLATAGFSVVGPDHPVLTVVEQDAVLPCRLSPSMDARSLEIRWTRSSFLEIVLLYRNGKNIYEEQMQEYAGRTELDKAGLSEGILDLHITGVKPSDDGQYVCTAENAASYGEVVVKLDVAATGSAPHLSLEAYEDGGIRVLCRSTGWYPQPQVLWEGSGGQQLPSVSQRRSSDERGLLSIEDATVVTRRGEGTLSCMVRSSRLNQELKSSIYISGVFFHNPVPWMAALGVFLILSVGLMLVGALLMWKNRVLSRELGWRKFLLPENPDVVTLDPNTTHCKLVLSPDFRRVHCLEEGQNLPDTPERYASECCVLGRERFSEGRHCWEVEVEGGEESKWAVGVAEESRERKNYVYFDPVNGFWGVGRFQGQFKALTTSRDTLTLLTQPRRIWVCLDYPKGLVTFINSDTGAEIFTYPSASFRERTLRPWFYLENTKTHLILKSGPA